MVCWWCVNCDARYYKSALPDKWLPKESATIDRLFPGVKKASSPERNCLCAVCVANGEAEQKRLRRATEKEKKVRER